MPKTAKRQRRIGNKVTDAVTLSSIAHTLLNVLLPIALFVLIQFGLSEFAFVLVALSKWRVLAVVPRHWPANIRSNATDIIVNFSTLIFMVSAEEINVQIAWTAWYLLWLTIFKPRSDPASVAFQALVGELLGISALLQLDNVHEVWQLLGVWYITTSAARHFLSSYQEIYTRVISYVWGLFSMQLFWVLYRWTLVYFIVPQIALIIGLLSYAIGSLYDQSRREELNRTVVRQHLFMTSVILFAIILLADWQGNF